MQFKMWYMRICHGITLYANFIYVSVDKIVYAQSTHV